MQVILGQRGFRVGDSLLASVARLVVVDSLFGSVLKMVVFLFVASSTGRAALSDCINRAAISKQHTVRC